MGALHPVFEAPAFAAFMFLGLGSHATDGPVLWAMLHSNEVVSWGAGIFLIGPRFIGEVCPACGCHHGYLSSVALCQILLTCGWLLQGLPHITPA